MTTTQPSGGSPARPESALRGLLNDTALGLAGGVGVLVATAAGIYVLAKIATIALVIVGLALGRGSFG